MYKCGDPLVRQMRLQFRAPRGQHRKLVPHCLNLRSFQAEWQLQIVHSRKTLKIVMGNLPSSIIFTLKIVELAIQHRSLHLIKPAVHSNGVINVTLSRSEEHTSELQS